MNERKTDKLKVAITGSGFLGAHVARLVADHNLSDQVEIIDMQDERFEKLAADATVVDDWPVGSMERLVSDKLDVTGGTFDKYFSPYVIRKLPEFKEFPEVKVKPTCKKHHEYVNTGEGWKCRHCQKSL